MRERGPVPAWGAWPESLRDTIHRVWAWWQERAERWPQLIGEPQTWGIRWSLREPAPGSLVPFVELRPLQSDRWVVLCLKQPQHRYSRNTYRYGGIYLDRIPDDLDRLEEIFSFLLSGFRADARPARFLKSLRLDLRELAQVPGVTEERESAESRS